MPKHQAPRFQKLTWGEVIFFGAIGLLAVAGIAKGVSEWIIVVVATVAAVIYGFTISSRRHRIEKAIGHVNRLVVDSKYSVTSDDEKIAVTFDGEPKDSIRWDEIRLIAIRIDDAFLPQPWWWIMGGPKGGFMYPSDAIGWQEAYHAMSQRLAGFDHVAAANGAVMMSGSVVVWQKPAE